MNTSIRELLGVTLKKEGRGFPVGVRIAVYVVDLAFVVAFTWAGSATAGSFGSVAGVVLGVLLGTYTSTAILRWYRTRHQAHE